MANFLDELNEDLIKFINNQKMFFVATAPKDGKINISPKGLDALRIIDNKTIVWLNHFGSGNETAAHLLEDNRMTLMFCAFEAKPLILRIYAKAKVFHERDEEFMEYQKLFDYTTGSRNIFELTIEAVNSSCGMGVPLFDFVAQRDELTTYYNKSSKEKQLKFMQKHNSKSFDGKDTGLFTSS